MRILGIDYGTKKIGFALSDEEQTIAFPKAVVPSGWSAVAKALNDFKKGNGFSEIVIGLPVGLDGKETQLSGEVRKFAKRLEEIFNIPIHFENEAYSSAAVKTASGEEKPENIDAASAAVILQSYLDRRKILKGYPWNLA